MAFITHIKRLDWVLIVTVFLITGFGLLSIYSSSVGRGDFLNFKKQVLFFGAGLLLMFVFSFLNWRVFRDDPYLVVTLYVICLLLLLGLYFFAPEIRGVKSWYKLGDFSFDPIEFAKIVLIIILAKYFSMRHIEMYRIRHILLSGFYLFLPTVLIFFQPNLGSVLILLSLWAGVLIISGIKIRHFLVLAFCGLMIFILSWATLLKDYQKERVLSFIQPQLSDPLKIGWSKLQAKIAIGSGGFLGQGFGRGSQTQYGFLPEPQTDFIFAAIAEEFGLVGAGVSLLLFSFLLWRIIKIAFMATGNFPRLFAAGLAISIFSQAFIHIGMNLGLLPIIGIPLPLISYGGSGLISVFIGLGVLQSIRTH